MTANELIEIIESEEYNPFFEEISDRLRQQEQEIEQLKEKLEDCTCQGGHSEAYLKAKGKL